MFRNLFPILNIVLVTVLIFFSVNLGYQILSAKLSEVASLDLSGLIDSDAYTKHPNMVLAGRALKA